MSEATLVPPPPSPEALAAWAAAEAEAERELVAEDAARAAAEAAQRASGKPPVQPGAAVPPHRGPVRGRGRASFYAAVLFACTGWGAVGSFVLTSAHRAPVPHTETDPTVGAPLAPTARIDALIRPGRFTDALRECLDAPRSAPGVPTAALAFREGVCLEGLENFKEAANAYRTAEADPNVAGWARALLGQARCAIALEEYLLARTLVNRAWLRSGHPDCRGASVCEDVLALRGRIALLVSGIAPARDPLDEGPAPAHRSAIRHLDWVPADSQPVAAAPARDVLEVHRALNAPGELRVTAHLGARPTIEVLRAIGVTAGWEVRAGAPVAAVLGRPVGPLDVDHLLLAEVLDQLVGADAVWVLQGNTLILLPAGPPPKPR